MEGGVLTGLHNGTNYTEVRKYEQGSTTIMFYFVTRCYGDYMQSILDEFKLDPPHVIIMNSCLWDLHRYGKNANMEFLTNISGLLESIDLAVPYEDRLFIWNATLPVREKVKAGFLPDGVDHTLPAEDIRKANLYVRDQLNEYGERFIFLDLHQTFYKHLDLRVKDGVHWNDFAHRKITCLILIEISRHWNFEIPSKSPMSPVRCELPPVGKERSMNDVPPATGDYPRSLLGLPPPSRNVQVRAPSANNPINNGFSGNFPGGNGPPLPRVNLFPGPLANGPRGPRVLGPVVSRLNSPSGPRVNGPPCPRLNVLPGPRMNGPGGSGLLGNRSMTNIPIRTPLGNAPVRNHFGPASNGPANMAEKRGGRNRRGRHRSATVNPGSSRHPPPPRGWLNSPPPFLNNNYVFSPPAGFPLNETFPPFPGKRKYIEEHEFERAYKFPRKFM